MNIALILQHKLMLGLQQLLGTSGGAEQQKTRQPRTGSVGLARQALVPDHSAVAGKPSNIGVGTPAYRPQAPAKPLRVLRVIEKDQHHSSSGRMVISGRMADVCAELDRLAAKESALH